MIRQFYLLIHLWVIVVAFWKYFSVCAVLLFMLSLHYVQSNFFLFSYKTCQGILVSATLLPLSVNLFVKLCVSFLSTFVQSFLILGFQYKLFIAKVKSLYCPFPKIHSYLSSYVLAHCLRPAFNNVTKTGLMLLFTPRF